jgi:hypothetical protein
MNVISTLINYKGVEIKIENKKIYCRSFGSTVVKQYRHWGWTEIEQTSLKPEFKDYLKENNLID